MHDKRKLMSSLILCVDIFYALLQTVCQSFPILMKDLREEKAGIGTLSLAFQEALNDCNNLQQLCLLVDRSSCAATTVFACVLV